MEKKYELIVDKPGERLDLFVALKVNALSRSGIKRAINNGDVLLNGAVEYRSHYKVKEGDAIVLRDTEGISVESDIIQPTPMKLDIIYEDKDLLVLNKPAGIVTHPATGHETDTLLNGVLFHYKQLSHIGDKKRSGLIHRLDKDTSGVILVGKTNLGLWQYSRLFAEKKVYKTYMVVACGDMTSRFKNQETLIVKTNHGRNPTNRKKFTALGNGEGKIAETHFELANVVIREGKSYSLLHAHPYTGRTHQIRVHLAGLGHPVLGDNIYGKQEYTRLMLHSWQLKIKLVGGAEKTFVAPVPKEFKEYITNAKHKE
jgi:23S rRNA pseudouridine1911/1915/1917 synthase